MYFKNISNLQELKTEYRKLAKKYHPDISNHENATDIMQEINKQYETLFNQLKNNPNNNQQINETSSHFIKIINELIKYKDININIVGTWLWIDGNTYPIKKQIKELGFLWSKSKRKWYYATTISKKKKRGTMSYDQIINKYGQKTIKSKGTLKYIAN